MDAAQQTHAKILQIFPQNLIYPSRILRHWVIFKTTTSLQSSIKHSALPHEDSKNTDWYFSKNDFDDNIVIPRRHPLCLKETNIQLMTPLWLTGKKNPVILVNSLMDWSVQFLQSDRWYKWATLKNKTDSESGAWHNACKLFTYFDLYYLEATKKTTQWQKADKTTDISCY